jgi:hypothetical protein
MRQSNASKDNKALAAIQDAARHFAETVRQHAPHLSKRLRKLTRLADALELSLLDEAAIEAGDGGFDVWSATPRPIVRYIDAEIACNGCGRVERVRRDRDDIGSGPVEYKTLESRILEALVMPEGYEAINGFDEAASAWFHAQGNPRAWLCAAAINEAVLCGDCASLNRQLSAQMTTAINAGVQ